MRNITKSNACLEKYRLFSKKRLFHAQFDRIMPRLVPKGTKHVIGLVIITFATSENGYHDFDLHAGFCLKISQNEAS